MKVFCKWKTVFFIHSNSSKINYSLEKLVTFVKKVDGFIIWDIFLVYLKKIIVINYFLHILEELKTFDVMYTLKSKKQDVNRAI